MAGVFSWEQCNDFLSGIPLLPLLMVILQPGPRDRLFPRHKESHDPPYNSYPQDNARGYCKEDSKEKGQLEDQEKEWYQ
jgi:hypothetical protein